MVSIVKVGYCKITYWRGWSKTLKHIENWLPYADYVIIIADETVTPEQIEEAKRKFNSPKLIIKREKFEGNIPAFRNKYLEEAERLGVDWVAVSDGDEWFNEEFRRDCHKIAEECEARGINVCEINCREQFEDHEWLDDADKLAASIIEPRESWYYKQLFFKLRPGLRYIGAGGLRRVHETWNLKTGWVVARLPREKYWYTHIKSPLDIWRNAGRNFVLAGGGLDVGEQNPYWKPLRKLMEKYGFRDWTSLEKAIMEHRIPDEMHKFFIECLDAPNTDYGRETRQLAKFYFWYNRDKITPEILEKIKHPPEPTDEQKVKDWITRCYLQILGRHPDPEGMKYWMRRIMVGQTPMHELPKYLMASKEYREKFGVKKESVRLQVPVNVDIQLTEETVIQALMKSNKWLEIKSYIDVGKFVLENIKNKEEFLKWFYKEKYNAKLEDILKWLK